MAAPTLRSSATIALASATLAALISLIAACSGSPAARTEAPSGGAPSPIATVAGPTDFAAWTERQGFGGSSGLANIAKLVRWVRDHPGEESSWNVDDETTDILRLAAWLDQHPATACWADYHATVRASLDALAADYAKAKVDIQAGGIVSTSLIDAMVGEANRAEALPAPAGCP
jgi:hypothetical protein